MFVGWYCGRAIAKNPTISTRATPIRAVGSRWRATKLTPPHRHALPGALGGRGQGERKARTLRRAFDRRPAAVCLRCFAHDRQPEAGAGLRARRGGTIEAVED